MGWSTLLRARIVSSSFYLLASATFCANALYIDCILLEVSPEVKFVVIIVYPVIIFSYDVFLSYIYY